MKLPAFAGQKNRGAIVTTLLISILLAGIAGFLYWFLNCPCERTPGGYLLGEESQENITDWSFVNEVPLCQIQISAGLLPHSINLNCSSLQRELFVGCANCEGKRWAAALTEDGQARIRINDIVYPVSARRLLDPSEMDHSWLAMNTKAGRPTDTPRPNTWWTFHLATSL